MTVENNRQAISTETAEKIELAKKRAVVVFERERNQHGELFTSAVFGEITELSVFEASRRISKLKKPDPERNEPGITGKKIIAFPQNQFYTESETLELVIRHYTHRSRWGQRPESNHSA